MAEKEASVYIVDVGRSMNRKHQNRNETDLDWAMRYVWDKITTTVSTGHTINELQHDQSYAHISVFQPISQILMPELRSLREKVKPSHEDQGDAVSALVLAIDMIMKHCKHLKYKRRIVLVTDGKGYIDSDPDSCSSIVQQLKSDNMELTVLGIDFDDPQYGFKEESKPAQKAENEMFLRNLTEQSDGVFGTMAQAVAELDIPRLKSTKPVHSYRGTLTLGDPKTYDSALSIDVERYPRTMIAKPPSASSFVLATHVGESRQSPGAATGDGDDDQETKKRASNLAHVRNTYSYTVADGETPGSKNYVPREELAKGYEYGRTVIPISESDENITKLESEAAMEIVGFVPKDKYERYITMGTSNIVIAQKTSEKAILALSSLIHALFELDSYAIARFVKKDNSEPTLTVLSPSVGTDYECLVENQLPFHEDIRPYRFPALDKIASVSGKVLSQHRFLPGQDLEEAMSDFVDQMDISQFGRDDDGDPTEYLALEDAFSPLLHRIEQATRWRAVRPMEPVPPIPEVLLKYSKPPQDLQEASKTALQRLTKAADVKKVPPKTKGRKRTRSTDRPLSGLDIDNLLLHQTQTQDSTPSAAVSPTNPIPTFKRALSHATSLDAIHTAVAQLSTIIHTQIRTSFGDSNYGRVVEELAVMREQLVELEEPDSYNEVLKGLRGRILGGAASAGGEVKEGGGEGEEGLGGDRRELWWLLWRNRRQVGMVDRRVSKVSAVGEGEAEEFMAGK